MGQVIVPVSGGWDSAITWLFVAGYIRDGLISFADNEAVAVFTDPGREHPLTYAMLDTLDALTERPIIRLYGPTWEEALEAHAWFLPYWRARWCTPMFKIKPFQAWIGGEEVVSYVGLRADEEERVGYLGDRGNNITPRYPLREMGICFEDRERIAREIGLPPSGPWSCDCCPFKNHILWVDLIEQFPERAEWCAWVEEEKERRGAGGYGWMRGYKIRELINSPHLRSSIRQRWWARHDHENQSSFIDDEYEATACLMCQIK